MSEVHRWNFPLKDLVRRRFQTALTVTSLAVCVSVTVFLLLFGGNLGVEVVSFTKGGSTMGFLGVYSRFILMVILFNSVAGIMVAYYLLAMTTSERVRDIGIMKAVGCLTEVVFGYFAFELLVIVSVSCLLGTIGGVFMSFASISLMNVLGFSISAAPLNPWLIVLPLFFFIFVFYVCGMRQIVKAARVEPVKALSPLFAWRTTHESTFSLHSPFAKNLLTKTAFRNLGRRRSTTLQSIACLSVIVALTTLAVVGGIVGSETMQSYVERAIGRDIVLVAQAEMTEQYKSLLQQSVGAGQAQKLSYLDRIYAIPDSMISKVREIKGVVKVDPRLVLEETVHGYAHISPDPENLGQYIVTGTHTTGKALILGVHPEDLVNDWLILGENLLRSDAASVIVGDALAATLFDNPWVQSFRAMDTEFKISGVCLDPLNNGMVVYVSFDRLTSIIGYTDYNILLLQVDSSDPSTRAEILAELQAVISGTGLTLLDLNEILISSKAFLGHIWSLLLSLSTFSFVNAVLSLMGYLMLSISGQQRDLSIMRALGAKPRTIVFFIMFETFLIVSAGVLIGLPLGTIVSFWFFMPEAVISQNAVLTIVAVLSVLISALCLSSLYPAKRIATKPVIEAMSQT